MRPLHHVGGPHGRRPPRPGRRRRVRRPLGATLAALLWLPLLGTSPATAASTAAPTAAQPPTDDRVAPELATVPTDSSNYQTALARQQATESRLRVAEQARDRAERVLAELGATEARLSTQLQAATVQRDVAARRVEELRAGLRELAVAAYVDGGRDEAAAELDVDLQASLDREADRSLVDTVTDHHRQDYTANVRRRDAAAREIDRTVLLLDGVRQRTVEAASARDAAVESVAALTLQLAADRKAVADARLTAQVVGADFPLVALNAFWKAAAIVNALAPGCNVRWTMLAGISRVEGVHGTWGGSALDGDGNTTERITGPPLNGERNTAVIRDSDGGLWDDDTVWDRGVGPMGFIPSSWRIFGGDGNGDGVLDPHNIYDATVGSAKLLCRTAGLDQEPNLRDALFRYNRSQRYVEIVIGHIRGYDSLNYPPPV